MNNTKEYIVQHGQSWLDISLKLYGTPIYAMDLATQNQANFTDEVPAGKSVITLDLPINETILHIYRSYQVNPCTGISAQKSEKKQGIGFWFIGTDFQVN